MKTLCLIVVALAAIVYLDGVMEAAYTAHRQDTAERSLEAYQMCLDEAVSNKVPLDQMHKLCHKE
jgi:hypothetical protein